MPFEIPIEMVVGIIGSLVFIAMLFYKLKHGKKSPRFGRHSRHHHGHRHHGHHHGHHHNRTEVVEHE